MNLITQSLLPFVYLFILFNLRVHSGEEIYINFNTVKHAINALKDITAQWLKDGPLVASQNYIMYLNEIFI